MDVVVRRGGFLVVVVLRVVVVVVVVVVLLANCFQLCLCSSSFCLVKYSSTILTALGSFSKDCISSVSLLAPARLKADLLSRFSGWRPWYEI